MSTLTVDEAKAHLNVTIADDDALIQTYIDAAEAWVMRFTSKALVNESVREVFDNFIDPVVLSQSPVQSITEVKYLDANGDQQTLGAEVYGATSLGMPTPATLFAKTGKKFPTTLAEPNSVSVTYVAGWGDAAAVPADLKQAVKLLVAWFYANREASIADAGIRVVLDATPGVYELVAPFREYVF